MNSKFMFQSNCPLPYQQQTYFSSKRTEHNALQYNTHLIIIISIQPFGRFWQEPQPYQSDDWYGSDTLHSWHVLRANLPLLFSAFRRFNFRRQMTPRPHQRESS
jgi:hypothetical protein